MDKSIDTRTPLEKAGAQRLHQVADMERRRHKWAAPRAPEPDFVASPEKLEAMLGLVAVIAPLAGKAEIYELESQRTGMSETKHILGFQVGNEYQILRTFETSTRDYRWSGVEFPPDDAKPQKKRFSGTKGMLDFVLSRMLIDAPTENREKIYEEVLAHAHSPLFNMHSEADEIVCHLKDTLEPPDAPHEDENTEPPEPVDPDQTEPPDIF
jgi:hypothetical protein